MNKTDFKGSIMLNPVPAVLITSRNNDGEDNVFTVGWIGTACTKPPMITVAIRPERLSYKYIAESKAFIVNLPSTNLVKAVDYCGVRSGKNTNKFKDMSLTLSQGFLVNCGIINECPIAFECVVKNITPLGSHHLFLAEIVKCHVDNKLIDDKGKIHFEKADLLAYSHGEYFGLNPHVLGSFGYSVRRKTQKDTNKNMIKKSIKKSTSNKKSKKSNTKNIAKTKSNRSTY